MRRLRNSSFKRTFHKATSLETPIMIQVYELSHHLFDFHEIEEEKFEWRNDKINCLQMRRLRNSSFKKTFHKATSLETPIMIQVYELSHHLFDFHEIDEEKFEWRKE